MTGPAYRVVDINDVQPNRRRGGDLRTMLSPGTVGSTSGFMGIAILRPGERVVEHYHPYSEEFLYVVQGAVAVDLDGSPHEMAPDQGLMIPRNVRHRVRNIGPDEARIVFHLSPLAPRPELGHVDTETLQGGPPARETSGGSR